MSRVVVAQSKVPASSMEATYGAHLSSPNLAPQDWMRFPGQGSCTVSVNPVDDVSRGSLTEMLKHKHVRLCTRMVLVPSMDKQNGLQAVLEFMG